MEKEKLQEISKIFLENNLTELYIEYNGEKIFLKKEENVYIQPKEEKKISYEKILKKEEIKEKSDQEDKNTKIIKSPITGTFYSAPAPNAPPFVNIGDKVTSDKVLCIIEAMKIMNEIKSDCSGIVKEIYIKNEETVQQGTPLFKIELE
ncbi:MAG TPA: acetyl-CoA carboxylase, biotin carboxyl carrier protein [bacterium]|mgnify:FL=1|nr:acetyl-CoA carboxylase, biotin carboxyl carrier protein [bacterium]HPQ19079.1 acetyl-CoA carboxylase, biotin carboxyl carrier protein [bacterium]